MPPDPKKRAVALVSGGLDSVVSLAAGLREADIRLVLFFNYHQGALIRERGAVLGVANYYQLPFREIDLGWLGDLAPAGICPKPEVSIKDWPDHLKNLAEVWVPNRNGVFLNVAAAFAESYGCDLVIAGFNREEASEFPDNRAEYVEKVNQSFKYSTSNGVEVRSYTQELSKSDILLLGHQVKAPLSVIWSCYLGGELMCGGCPSCLRLRRAMTSLPEDRRPRLEFEKNDTAEI